MWQEPSFEGEVVLSPKNLSGALPALKNINKYCDGIFLSKKATTKTRKSFNQMQIL